MKQKIKRRYKGIVSAIYEEALISDIDVRVLLREWIQIFDRSRVVGWSRSDFLDECILYLDERNESIGKYIK